MKTLKRNLILLIIVFGGSLNLFSQTPSSIYSKAITEYNEGNYDYAKDLFLELYNKDYKNFEVCYNLGNCYYRLNDMPNAILYYERAKKINAYDKDLFHNLEVANSNIVDRFEVIPETFLVRFWNRLVSIFTPTVWIVLFFVFLFIVLILLFLVFFGNRKKIRKTSLVLTIVFFCLFIFTTFINNSIRLHYQRQDSAIIFDNSVSAKGSPSEESVDVFVIHKGTKVAVKNTVGEWIEIVLSNGKVGWITFSSLEFI